MVHDTRLASEEFIEAIELVLEETGKYYPEMDIKKASNGNTSGDIYKQQIFRHYNNLVDRGATIEAYLLLRLAFGTMTTQDLMQLHRQNRLFTEQDAYDATKAPF